MGNGFFKELVPVITSFVKLTKKRNANQFIINQLASQVVDYYDKFSNLAFIEGLLQLQSFDGINQFNKVSIKCSKL